MATYHYRRKLTLKEQLPALGAAVGAGAAVFYLASVWLQRTPLRPGAGLAPVIPPPPPGVRVVPPARG